MVPIPTPRLNNSDNSFGGVDMPIKHKLSDQQDAKPIDLKWLIIISIVILFICVFIPFVFSLAMRVDFRATIDSINAREFQVSDDGTDLRLTDPNLRGGLPGAISESFKKTVFTEYKGIAVPSKLEKNKGSFIAIGFLHGPALVTGTSLVFDSIPEASHADLVSSAAIRLSNLATPIVFYLVFILFILFIYWVSGNPNSALRFIITISIVWLVWSLFTWALAGFTTAQISGIFNEMLTEEQGSAQYKLGLGNIFAPPLRIFMAGMLCWVVSYLLKRAKIQSDAALRQKA